MNDEATNQPDEHGVPLGLDLELYLDALDEYEQNFGVEVERAEMSRETLLGLKRMVEARVPMIPFLHVAEFKGGYDDPPAAERMMIAGVPISVNPDLKYGQVNLVPKAYPRPGPNAELWAGEKGPAMRHGVTSAVRYAKYGGSRDATAIEFAKNAIGNYERTFGRRPGCASMSEPAFRALKYQGRDDPAFSCEGDKIELLGVPVRACDSITSDEIAVLDKFEASERAGTHDSDKAALLGVMRLLAKHWADEGVPARDAYVSAEDFEAIARATTGGVTRLKVQNVFDGVPMHVEESIRLPSVTLYRDASIVEGRIDVITGRGQDSDF